MMQKEAIDIVEEIGGERVIEPLIELLEKGEFISGIVIDVLGNLGNLKSVKPLIDKLIENNANWRRKNLEKIATALGKLGDKRAVEPLIEILEECLSSHKQKGTHRQWSYTSYGVRDCSEFAKALGKIGDERGIEPLVKGLDNDWEYWTGEEKNAIIGSICLLIEKLEMEEKEKVKRFLIADDPSLRMMGLSILKGMTPERS